MRRPPTGRALGGAVLAVWAALAAHALPAKGAAQGLESLASSCSGGSPGLERRCRQVALALEGVRGLLGGGAGLGTEIPGSASTLGLRLQRIPRLSLSGRVGGIWSRVPAVLDGYSLTDEERGILVPLTQASGTVELFDGLSLLPTVGGILAVDLTGSYHQLYPPASEGFGGPVGGWGVAGRLGILRESFELPGISVSLARRALSRGKMGNVEGADPAEMLFETSVTSLRGMVGKDLLGIGILLGVGLDWLGGEGALALRTSPGGIVRRTNWEGLESQRKVFFVGGGMTFLVLQMSAEGGIVEPQGSVWNGGEEAGSGTPQRAYFGSFALRITF